MERVILHWMKTKKIKGTLPVAICVVVCSFSFWLISLPLANIAVPIEVVEGPLALPVSWFGHQAGRLPELSEDFSHVPPLTIFLFYKGVRSSIFVDTFEHSICLICNICVREPQ